MKYENKTFGILEKSHTCCEYPGGINDGTNNTMYAHMFRTYRFTFYLDHVMGVISHDRRHICNKYNDLKQTKQKTFYTAYKSDRKKAKL